MQWPEDNAKILFIGYMMPSNRKLKTGKVMEKFENYLAEVEKQKKEHQVISRLADAQEQGAVILDPSNRVHAVLKKHIDLMGDPKPDIDEIHPINFAHAKAAEEAVLYYAYRQGMDAFSAADIFASTYDLMSDLLHLCHQRDFGVDKMIEAVRSDQFEIDLVEPERKDIGELDEDK